MGLLRADSSCTERQGLKKQRKDEIRTDEITDELVEGFCGLHGY